MRRMIGAAAVAVFSSLMVWSSTPAVAGPAGPHGVSVASGGEDGSLLLRNESGFHLVVVDPSVTIQGPGGQRIALPTIQPGDRVEYTTEPWRGMSIVTSLRVIPALASRSRP